MDQVSLKRLQDLKAQYRVYLRVKNKTASAAITFLESQNQILSPRLFYYVCREAGVITRELANKRIAKNWPAVQSPQDDLTRSIFDGDSERSPVYNPPPQETYYFEDLYTDAPEWQRELIDQIIHDDINDLGDAGDLDSQATLEDTTIPDTADQALGGPSGISNILPGAQRPLDTPLE